MKNIVGLLVLPFMLMLSSTVFAGGPLMDEPFVLTIGDTPVSFLSDFGNEPDDRYKFYYLPIRPRLAMRKDERFGEIPVFTFIKYNFDPEKAGLMQGGIIQLAVMIGLAPNEEKEAKKKIAKQKNLPEDRVSIGMVNVTEARIEVLGVKGQITKGKGREFTASILGEGPSIRHPSAQAPFVLEVSPEGSAIYEEMLTGGAGLGFNYTYTYEAFTPKVHVEINADGGAIYTHYSKSQQAKMDLGDWWFSYKAEGNWQKVREDLVENTNFVIDWHATRPNEDDPAGKKIIELVETTMVNKVLTGIFDIKPPKMDEKPVSDAKAPETQTGWFGGFSYGINEKSVSRSRSKKIHFEYRSHNKISIPMNKTGSFVSIRPKSDEHKAVMFREVEADEFFGSAEFTIAPPMGKPKVTGISSISYYIVCNKTTLEQSYVSDTKGRSYLMMGNEEGGFLKTYCANPDGKYDISYHVELVQQQGKRSKTLVGKKIKPLEKNVGFVVLKYEPQKWGFEQVEIDAGEFLFKSQAEEQREEEEEALDDRDIDDEDELEKLREQLINPNDYPKYIKGRLKHGKAKYSFKLNAEIAEEGPIVWYTKADDKPITLKLTAYKYKSKPRKRKHEYYKGKGVDLEGEELIILDNDSFK